MFSELLGALQASGIPFAAYKWDRAPQAPYGIVQLEGGADTVPGDDRILLQAVRGSVDLFAPTYSAEWPEAVQAAMAGVVAWQLNSVQYEDDTRLIHYEWLFEGVGY